MIPAMTVVVITILGCAFACTATNLGTFSLAPPMQILSPPPPPADVFVPWTVDAGKLDGDGLDDVAVTTYHSHITQPDLAVLILLFNDGGGSFTRVTIPSVPYARPLYIVDMDNDGFNDVVAASYLQVAWFRNVDNARTFDPTPITLTGSFRTHYMDMYDVNGDGWLDVVGCNYYAANSPMWWFAGPGPNLVGPTAGHLIIDNPSYVVTFGLTVTDLHNDTLTDIVASVDSYVIILTDASPGGNGTGSWTVTHVGDGDPFPRASIYEVKVGDFNGDGTIDLLALGYTDRFFRVYNNTGPGTTFPVYAQVDVYYPLSAVVGDIDGDGDLDVCFASYVGDSALVFFNSGDGAFSLGPSVPSVVSSPRTVAIANLDGYGHSDIVIPSYVGGYVSAALTNPIYGPASVVELSGATTVDVEINTPTTLVIDLYALAGNRAVEYPLSADIVDIVIKFESAVTTVTDKVFAGTPAEPAIAFTFAVDRPGSYTLVVRLAGDDVGDSPFVVVARERCLPGSRIDKAIACLPCDPGTYSSVPDAVACTSCPPFMVGPGGASSYTNCSCFPGFWLGPPPRVEAAPCVPCPLGAVCPGAYALPQAASGFYAAGIDTFRTCPREDSCAGNGLCRTGYTGYACATCAKGYYSASASICRPCPSASTAIFVSVTALLFLLAFVAASVTAWSLGRAYTLSLPTGGADDHGDGLTAIKSYDYDDGSEASRRALFVSFRTHLTPATVAMIIVAFQVTGMIANAELGWTSSSRSVLRLFAIFNVDTSLFASECSLASFHLKYAVSLIIPLFILAVVIVVMLAIQLVAPRSSLFLVMSHIPIRIVIDAALFTAAPLLYIPVARATLILFHCIRLDNGDIVLSYDRGVTCYDADWWSVFPLALLVTLVFILGVPVYFAVSLWRHSADLFTRDGLVRFGTLHRLYRRRFYWGEVANLAKRLALVLVAVFAANARLVLISLLLFLLLLSTFLLLAHRPYFAEHHNATEIRISVVLILLVLIGAASYAERDSPSRPDTVFLVVTVFAVLALIVVSVHALVIDLRHISRARSISAYALSHRVKLLNEHVALELDELDANASLRGAANTMFLALDDFQGGADHDRTHGTELGPVTSI